MSHGRVEFVGMADRRDDKVEREPVPSPVPARPDAGRAPSVAGTPERARVKDAPVERDEKEQREDRIEVRLPSVLDRISVATGVFKDGDRVSPYDSALIEASLPEDVVA